MSLLVTVVGGARTPQARGLAAWLARTAPRRAGGELTLAIVGDMKMRALNREFRRKDMATDVLSFPAARAQKGQDPVLSGDRKGLSRPFLGEIAIAKGVAVRQAREMGHTLRIELRILALHGLLHLLGYDHEVDNGEMARVERRLRRRGGLPHGLIARSS